MEKEKTFEDFAEEFEEFKRAERLDSMEEKQAFRSVKRAYFDKKRPNGEPCIEHIVRVLQNAVNYGGHDFVIVAMLHDALEDKVMSYEQIAKDFGGFTAECVEILTLGEKQMDGYYKEIFSSYYATSIKILDVYDLLTNYWSDELAKEAEEYLLPYMMKYEKNKFYIEYIEKLEDAIKSGRGE